jgi:hypothetical protein
VGELKRTLRDMGKLLGITGYIVGALAMFFVPPLIGSVVDKWWLSALCLLVWFTFMLYIASLRMQRYNP